MKIPALFILLLLCNAAAGQQYEVCSCDTATDATCGKVFNPRYCFYSDKAAPDSLVTPDFIYKIFPQLKNIGKTTKVPFYRHQFYVEIPEKAGMVDLRLNGARVRCTFEPGVKPVLLLPSSDFTAFQINITRGNTIWLVSYTTPQSMPSILELGVK